MLKHFTSFSAVYDPRVVRLFLIWDSLCRTWVSSPSTIGWDLSGMRLQ